MMKYSFTFSLTEMNEYSTLRETRVLLNTTISNQMFTIDELIPDSSYSVTVMASNTRGSVSSNEVRLTMPRGSKSNVQFLDLESVKGETHVLFLD